MANGEPPQQGKSGGGREPLPPAKRKRLDKIFEVAKQKAATAATSSDFDYATKLLTECVSGDPGNAIFVRTFLENLQKKYKNNRKGAPMAQFKVRVARGMVKKAVALGQFDEAVCQGLKALVVNPWDGPTLTSMAAAAKKMGDRDPEELYLRTALAGSPKDPSLNRLYAITLAERGLIDQSIAFWSRVEEALPNDDEAKRNIASLMVQKARASGKFDDDDDLARRAKFKKQQEVELTEEQKLRRKVQNEPENTAYLIELAQFYMNEDRFAEAEPLLANAYKLSDGNVDVREQWQDCQIRLVRQRIGQTHDPEKRKKLERLFFEKDMQRYRDKVQRFPNNLTYKYEYGYRLMKTGRIDEAIRELQQAQNEPRRKGMCLLALGRCFEAIEQDDLALQHYEAAIQEIPDRDGNNKKEALRKAGKLALKMDKLETAEKHLQTLAAVDFTYKDISQLLDKLRKRRDNLGPGGNKPAAPET